MTDDRWPTIVGDLGKYNDNSASYFVKYIIIYIGKTLDDRLYVGSSFRVDFRSSNK